MLGDAADQALAKAKFTARPVTPVICDALNAFAKKLKKMGYFKASHNCGNSFHETRQRSPNMVGPTVCLLAAMWPGIMAGQIPPIRRVAQVWQIGRARLLTLWKMPGRCRWRGARTDSIPVTDSEGPGSPQVGEGSLRRGCPRGHARRRAVWGCLARRGDGKPAAYCCCRRKPSEGSRPIAAQSRGTALAELDAAP